MTPEMAKAMLEAWIKTVLTPFIKGVAKSSIPAAEICGMLGGALVAVAKKAGWTKDDLLRVVADIWEPAAPDHKPD